MLEERVEPLAVEVAPRAVQLSTGLRLLEGVVVVEKVEHQLVSIRRGQGGGGGIGVGGGGVWPGSGRGKGRSKRRV